MILQVMPIELLINERERESESEETREIKNLGFENREEPERLNLEN